MRCGSILFRYLVNHYVLHKCVRVRVLLEEEQFVKSKLSKLKVIDWFQKEEEVSKTQYLSFKSFIISLYMVDWMKRLYESDFINL